MAKATFFVAVLALGLPACGQEPDSRTTIEVPVERIALPVEAIPPAPEELAPDRAKLVEQAVTLYHEHTAAYRRRPGASQQENERMSLRAFFAYLELQCAHNALLEQEDGSEALFLSRIRMSQDEYRESMRYMYQEIDYMDAYSIDRTAVWHEYAAELRRRDIAVCPESQ